jgi:hypothetical protein
VLLPTARHIPNGRFDPLDSESHSKNRLETSTSDPPCLSLHPRHALLTWINHADACRLLYVCTVLYCTVCTLAPCYPTIDFTTTNPFLTSKLAGDRARDAVIQHRRDGTPPFHCYRERDEFHLCTCCGYMPILSRERRRLLANVVSSRFRC